MKFIDPDDRGPWKIFAKTVKGILKTVSRENATKILREGGNVYVKGEGSSRKAKRLVEEAFPDKPIKRHSPHQEGWNSHAQTKNGGGAHANCKLGVSIPGATLGNDILGDNIFGDALNFFNPLDDIQSTVDLYNEVVDLIGSDKSNSPTTNEEESSTEEKNEDKTKKKKVMKNLKNSYREIITKAYYFEFFEVTDDIEFEIRQLLMQWPSIKKPKRILEYKLANALKADNVDNLILLIRKMVYEDSNSWNELLETKKAKLKYFFSNYDLDMRVPWLFAEVSQNPLVQRTESVLYGTPIVKTNEGFYIWNL